MLLTVLQFDTALLAFTACVFLVSLAATWVPVVLSPKSAKPQYVKSALINTIFTLALYAGLVLLLAITGGFTYRASEVVQLTGFTYAFVVLEGVLLVSSAARLIRRVVTWQRWRQERSTLHP